MATHQMASWSEDLKLATSVWLEQLPSFYRLFLYVYWSSFQIAIGGTIGTGLFVGSGEALNAGGPVGLLLGYTIMGAVVYSMMMALGEMATLFPVSGSFVSGFFIGLNYRYSTPRRYIMQLGGSIRLSVFPLAIPTGARMRYLYLPKSPLRPLLFLTGILQPTQHCGFLFSSLLLS